MSEYTIRCGSCGTDILFTDDLAGETHPCPQCGAQVLMDVAAATPAAAGDAPEGLYQAPCTHCGTPLEYGDDLAGQLVECPNCNTQMTLPPVPPAASGAAPAPEPAPEDEVEAAPGVLADDDAGPLPERMKANRLLADRVCGHCNNPIDLGQDVWNCPQCGWTMHLGCHERAGGCATPACANAAASAPAKGKLSLKKREPALEAQADDALGPDQRHCPYCDEIIRKGARKCRHCGEYVNARDRERAKKRSSLSSEDDSLSAGEIIFGILCSGIACIVGLIWGIQGKKKGWKLMLLAIIVQVIGSIIQLAMEH